MVPLQMGSPGGPELLVVLLILLLLFGVPVVLLALGVIAYRRTTGDDRVEKLEARREHLEAELERERSREGAETGGDDDRKA